MRLATRLAPIVFLVSGGLIGCGGDETSRIKLVPVTGNVTHNGKPLEGATVTFTPDPSNPGGSTPGSDVTGPEGNYKMIFRGRSGLAPGKYKVVVTKTILPAGVSASSAGEDPYMNQVAVESAVAPKGGGADAVAKEVKGEFDQEVDASGSTIDMDVKGTAKPISKK